MKAQAIGIVNRDLGTFASALVWHTKQVKDCERAGNATTVSSLQHFIRSATS